MKSSKIIITCITPQLLNHDLFQSYNRRARQASVAADGVKELFQYALLLSQSSDREQLKQGKSILQKLLADGLYTEECLYYLSLTCCRLGDLSNAR